MKTMKPTEFFSVLRSAVKVTYEHSDGHSYSYFAPKHAAEFYEKNLRDANCPTNLADYVVEHYSCDDYPLTKLDPKILEEEWWIWTGSLSD